MVDSSTMTNITNSIERAKLDVGELVRQYKSNKLDAEPGMTVRATFEHKVRIGLGLGLYIYECICICIIKKISITLPTPIHL